MCSSAICKQAHHAHLPFVFMDRGYCSKSFQLRAIKVRARQVEMLPQRLNFRIVLDGGVTLPRPRGETRSIVFWQPQDS